MEAVNAVQHVANPTASFETTAASADSYPSIIEMTHKFEYDLGVSGDDAVQVIDQACKQLGVNTDGLSLTQKAEKAYDMMYRSAGATTTKPGGADATAAPGSDHRRSAAQVHPGPAADAASLAQRAEGLEDPRIWWTPATARPPRRCARCMDPPGFVEQLHGPLGVAPASPPPSETASPEIRGELSNFGSDFPRGRLFFSCLLWLAIAAIIGCYGKRCCDVAPAGQDLVVANHDIGSNGGRNGGDEARARALRNNGFCECAPLGGECGCTKWEGTAPHGDDPDEEKEVRIYACPAPMCCQTGVCAHNESAWGGIYGPPGTLTEWRDIEDTRKYASKGERNAARAHQHPRCFATDDPESSAEARKPNCNCCDDGTKRWCNYPLLIICFTMLPVCWCNCWFLDVAAGRRRNCRVQHSMQKRTQDLCDAGVVITFHNKCSHQADDDSGEVVTHQATEIYAGPGSEKPIRSQEVGTAPLRATTQQQGDGWAIDWRDENGAPHRTMSRHGVVEMRIELKLSWKSEKDRVEFLERYARFKEKEENRQDIQQKNWITAELKNGIVADLVPSTSELYILGGEDGKEPCCIVGRSARPFTVLGLGWIYQLAWNATNAVVCLPLHKVLEFETEA